jgi:hypothetical protein
VLKTIGFIFPRTSKLSIANFPTPRRGRPLFISARKPGAGAIKKRAD